jgi:hypothetical protein
MDHCCERMRESVEYTCERHPDRFDCPDCLVDHDPNRQVYGLIIHDGGSSTIAIDYCPWCGASLHKN